MILFHQSVPLSTARCHGKFRYPLRSGLVRCCGGSSILVMGCVKGSCRGRCCVAGGGGCLGHLVVWSLRGLRFLESCADSCEDDVEGGRVGGVWCRTAPGEVVTRQALGAL